MLINSNNDCYSPNFGAMKKSQFQGLDLVCVNTFKAPIEKFNLNIDLQNWASKFLNKDTFQKSFDARTPFATDARKNVFKDWMDYFNQNATVSKAAALVMMKSLFGDLKSKTDNVPPVFNNEAFEKTMKDVENKPSFNFKKEYATNLQNSLLKEGENLEHGWIKIDSKINDPENFEKNLQRMKMYSNSSWCTKSWKADEYLAKGNFYIYYDNNKPVVGIRTNGNSIYEIQGEKNNAQIPVKYLDDILKFVDKEGLDKAIVRNYIDAAYDKIFTINQYKKAYAKEIEANDGKAILAKFAEYVDKNEDGKLVLSRLRPMENGITLSDLGVDENKTFEDISIINDDACFSNSNATRLSKLEYVNGDLDLRNSCITDISSLKEVKGDVDLRGSRLCAEDFKNVKVHGEIKVRKVDENPQ